VAEGDSGFAQIVRGHFHVYFVTDADAYEILAHFAGDMGENFVTGRQGNAEHGAGQHLGHRAGQFYWLFLCHW